MDRLEFLNNKILEISELKSIINYYYCDGIIVTDFLHRLVYFTQKYDFLDEYIESYLEFISKNEHKQLKNIKLIPLSSEIDYYYYYPIGSYLNFQDSNGMTPLMNACVNPNLTSEKTIKILLKYVNHIDLNIDDNYGNTVLMLACKNSNVRAVKNLLEYKIDLNLKNNNSDNVLTLSKNYKIIKMLLKHDLNINDINNNGDTALMILCLEPYIQFQTKIIKLLLEKGAKVNIKNDQGYTALMFATYEVDGLSSKSEIIKLLMEYGADPNLKNKNGKNTLTLLKKFL